MKKPLRVDRLAFKTIGAETIILDTKVGKEVHQLNAVASLIWNLCDGLHTTEDIVNEVCLIFEVQRVEAASDVDDLISELTKKSLLVQV